MHKDVKTLILIVIFLFFLFVILYSTIIGNSVCEGYTSTSQTGPIHDASGVTTVTNAYFNNLSQVDQMYMEGSGDQITPVSDAVMFDLAQVFAQIQPNFFDPECLYFPVYKNVSDYIPFKNTTLQSVSSDYVVFTAEDMKQIILAYRSLHSNKNYSYLDSITGENLIINTDSSVGSSNFLPGSGSSLTVIGGNANNITRYYKKYLHNIDKNNLIADFSGSGIGSSQYSVDNLSRYITVTSRYCLIDVFQFITAIKNINNAIPLNMRGKPNYKLPPMLSIIYNDQDITNGADFTLFDTQKLEPMYKAYFVKASNSQVNSTAGSSGNVNDGDPNNAHAPISYNFADGSVPGASAASTLSPATYSGSSLASISGGLKTGSGKQTSSVAKGASTVAKATTNKAKPATTNKAAATTNKAATTTNKAATTTNKAATTTNKAAATTTTKPKITVTPHQNSTSTITAGKTTQYAGNSTAKPLTNTQLP